MIPFKRFPCIIFFALSTLQLQSQCLPPTVSTGGANTQTTAEIYLNNTTSGGTYYIEYGLAGFIPGTAASAGAGGTLVAVPVNQTYLVVSGLTPNTSYQAYARKNCSGVWSSNSNPRQFYTAFNCSAAQSIACNSMIITNHPIGNGAWWSSACSSGSGGSGSEVIFSYTPTLSGNHKIFIPANYSSTDFQYKAASGGCTSVGWSCIGSTYSVGQGNTAQYTFGPLTAGVPYLIRADVQITSSQQTSAFRIECPQCAEPVFVSATNIVTTAATIHWTGSYSLIEYGPPGFTPGIGSTPGINGTIAYGYSGTQLNNLTPLTGYDVYVRTYCSPNNYSPNSNKISFATAQCPPVTPYFGSGVALYFNPMYGLYSPIGNCFYATEGEEKILRYTATSTGYYEMRVYNPNYAFYTVALGQNCNITNSSCQSLYSHVNNDDIYYIGPLTAGITYDIIFDAYYDPQLPVSFSLDVSLNCPMPSGVVASNFQSGSVQLNWSCNLCQANSLLEYGPVGFTPGTGATAGVNGTIITNVSPPYTLSGLQPNTKYDVYLRTACGTSYTSNTPVKTIRTAIDCSSAAIVACGDNLTFSVPGFSSTGNEGAWQSNVCGNNNNLSREQLWKFTPTLTGSYSLLCYNFTAGSSGYQYSANIYIKPESAGCNELNWICASSFSTSLTTFSSFYVQLGNLTAGTTYYILADGVQPTFTSGYTYHFNLTCNNVCSRPILTGATTTANSATISGSCYSCSGVLYLEYGPAGFTPGTGSTAGVNGTLIPNVSFPVTISGLVPETTYDVYARNDCGSPLGFSVNSVKISVTPCFTAPTSISASVSGSICLGDSVVLTQVGGILPPSGVFKWYTGSCGSTLAGTGNSITVSPQVSTDYRVRIEAGCGTSACSFAKHVAINWPGPVTITATGPTSFCTGGSVLLIAPQSPGFLYQWQKDGTNISGATNDSLVATTSGIYTVVVSNYPCNRTSDPVTVSVSGLPVVSFSGLASGYTNTQPPVSLTGSPSGGTFSGPGITGNQFDPAAAGVGGPYTILYSYTDGNGCSNSASQQTTVTGCTTPPAQPGTITTSGGTTLVCPGDTRTYTITPVSGAASYNWTPPPGGVITNGQGTVSVTIDYTSGFTVADTLKVAAVNNCGTGPIRTLRIFRNNPATPGVISGETYGVCNQQGVPYSVPVVAGVTNNWSLNTQSAVIASGNGTPTVLVNFNSNFNSAILSVNASNACGTSINRNLTIRPKPATPASITGPASVCSNQQGVPYSITPLYGASDYSWGSPKKSRIHDGVSLSNNNSMTTTSSSITVNYGNSAGEVRVRGNNACGSGAYQTMTVSFTCREAGAFASSQPAVLLHPNPVMNELNVVVTGADTYQVQIVNALGEPLQLVQNATVIDLSMLPPGMYFVKVMFEAYTRTLKIVKTE